MKTLNSLYLLDKWDVAVIQYVKSNNLATVEGIKKIWCIRNLSKIEDIGTSYLVSHFIEIINRLQLFNAGGIFDLIAAASPQEIWKYNSAISYSLNDKEVKRQGEAVDYYDRWMYVIMSKLRQAEVIKLPGYMDTINNDDDFYKKVKTYDD